MEFEEIDYKALADELALRRFKEEYEDVLPYETIYQAIVSGDTPEEATMSYEIRPYYASIYFGIVEEFKELILEFRKQ